MNQSNKTINVNTPILVAQIHETSNGKLDFQTSSPPHVLPLKDRIIEKTAGAMWSSGYPATHMLMSHLVRKTFPISGALLPILFIAATLEIAEEFL